MIRVVLADDQALIREAFAALLQLASDIVVVGQAADGHAALGLVVKHEPDVVLMDVQMPTADDTAPDGIIHPAVWTPWCSASRPNPRARGRKVIQVVASWS